MEVQYKIVLFYFTVMFMFLNSESITQGVEA